MSIKKFVFVLMPFKEEFNDLYELGIKSVCNELSCGCERVDEQIFNENIVERIYKQIQLADVIIADMTGRNPNVFYEVGYAHALRKLVILLTQESNDIPFDLRQYPHIIYNNSIIKLKSKLKQTLEHYIHNPPMVKPLNIEGQVKKFDSLDKTYEYIVEKMQIANRIDDISWAKSNTQEKSLADKKGYNEYLKIKKQILQKKNVIYREVFTFPNKQRLTRAKELILGDYHSYNAVYFNLHKEDSIPRLSFIIFDSVELVIFFYLSSHKSAYKEVRIAIVVEGIVNLFQDFYDNIYSEGEVLKDADFINFDLLQKIESKLKM